MKKLLIIFVVALFVGACQEEEVGVFSLEDAYVYITYEGNNMQMGMTPDSTYYFYNMSSLMVNSTQTRDTFMLRLKIAGTTKNVDRQIRLRPWNFEIAGRQVAVPGVNYVAFDAPEMEDALVLPADSTTVSVPIIVMFDSATAEASTTYSTGFVLPFELSESEDLKVLGTNSDISVVDKAARTHFYVQFTQTNN